MTQAKTSHGVGSPYMRRIPALIVIVAVGLSPYLGIPNWDPSLATFVWLSATAAISLNIVFGYAGMLSLGTSAFVGSSAYVMGLLHHELDVPLVGAAIAGVAVSALLAAALGIILVRLSGIYFALATLGVVFAFEGLVRAFPTTTGGSSGLTIQRELDFRIFTITGEHRWYLASTALVLSGGLVAYYLGAGRTGRILRLIRHDPLAAAILGVDVAKTRLIVFVLSASLAGCSGVVLFLWQGVITPESAGLLKSIEFLAMTVVGGVGNWLGPVVGAFLLTWIDELARGLETYREILFGTIFLGTVLFAQHGIVGLVTSTIQHLRRGEAEAPDYTHGAARARVHGPASVQRAPVPLGEGLRVDLIAKSFGGVVAVNNVTMNVSRGAVTALIGPNGAGKSTMMNIISGIELQEHGTVRLGGVEVTRLAPAARAAMGMARTFQVPRLVPEMTVWSNVALGSDAVGRHVFRRRRSDERETMEAALAALRSAGLFHLAYRRADDLGSGERKIVELVRALAWQPFVLLMDEPAVGLNDEELVFVRDWLDRLRDQGAAILLVDHNMDFISDVADAVYLIDSGEITAAGSPSEVVSVLRRPKVQTSHPSTERGTR